MQFTLPYQDVLTLPSGAGPNDDRIELDGINGEIRVYDGATLVGSWNSTDFRVGDDLSQNESRILIIPGPVSTLALDPANSVTLGQVITAQVFADLLTSDDTPYLGIVGPRLALETAARIDLYGSNASGAFQVPVIRLAPNAGGGTGGYVEIVEDGTDTDLKIGTRSYPRGELAYVQAIADDALVAATEELFDICIINGLPVKGGRIHQLEGQASFSAITTRIVFRFRYTEDGSVPTTASPIMEETIFNTTAVGLTGGTGRIKARYVPASNLNLSVGLFLSAVANITAFGANDQHGYISVTDAGST